MKAVVDVEEEKTELRLWSRFMKMVE